MAPGLAGGKDVSTHWGRPTNYIEKYRFVKSFFHILRCSADFPQTLYVLWQNKETFFYVNTLVRFCFVQSKKQVNILSRPSDSLCHKDLRHQFR